MKNIGSRIKKVRQLLKKSQQELADELKVTKQAISNVETDKCAPSITLLSKLLLDYNINLNYLIGAKGSVYINDDKSSKTIRASILKEVEKMLSDRGIE